MKKKWTTTGRAGQHFHLSASQGYAIIFIHSSNWRICLRYICRGISVVTVPRYVDSGRTHQRTSGHICQIAIQTNALLFFLLLLHKPGELVHTRRICVVEWSSKLTDNDAGDAGDSFGKCVLTPCHSCCRLAFYSITVSNCRK